MYEFNKRIYDRKWETPGNKKKLEDLLKKYPTPVQSDCPLSWIDEVSDLLDTIAYRYSITLKQYKEKLGELRVYYEPEQRDVDRLIAETEEKLKKKGVYR